MMIDVEGIYTGPGELLVSPDGEKFSPEEWMRLAVKQLAALEDEEARCGEGKTSDQIIESLKTLRLEYGEPSDPEDSGLCTISDVDFAPIRAWISRCDEDEIHHGCKATRVKWTNFPGVHFKLIDTQRRCVVNAEGEDVRFIALSYVWGGDQPKLTSSTISLLMSDGGLDKIGSSLPTTIRDAISACEKLGERYLWIDALCIVQDSIKDKKLQLLRMRQIYSAARCTIAAVSADAAKEGLLPRKRNSHGPDLPDRCKSETDLDALLREAPWSSRAWCYQEKVLSHRMIFFTTAGIYLQCQEGTCDALNGRELIKRTNVSTDRFDRVGAMLSENPGEDVESFLSAVEYFSQRKLTVKNDKMNAFQGVFQRYRGRMDGKESSFTFGLPICAFDQTFCWRHESNFHHPRSRNDCFPSWSWLGWDGPVTWDRALVRHTRTNQMIYDFESHALGDRESIKVRKPVNASLMIQERHFGFPASGGGLYHNAVPRHMDASVADLRIASEPINTGGESNNGLYAVYPVWCSQGRPPTPPQTMSLLDWFNMPMPMPNIMDEETAAAPSLPAKKQVKKEYEAAEHEGHVDCEAYSTVLGYIWLDREWRRAQPEHCVMEFMALHGEKDEQHQHGAERIKVDEKGGDEEGGVKDVGNDEEKWTITMLMLMQRMAKKEAFWARERVQIMDCTISEGDWEKTNPNIISLKLV